VRLLGASSLTNGAAGHATALIEGYSGIYTNAANTTVTNFGTIAGLGGVALDFYPSANDTLVVEAGCAFEGAVLGGEGTLELGSGTGTISNFGTAALTVSGSMAATTFQGFDTVIVSNGAAFTDGGAVTLAAGQTVQSAGILTLGGAGKAASSTPASSRRWARGTSPWPAHSSTTERLQPTAGPWRPVAQSQDLASSI